MAKRIALRRKELGWKQHHLAEHSGVKYETVRNLERGGKRASKGKHLTATLAPIARALDRDLRWIMGEIDEPLPAPPEADGGAPAFLPVRDRLHAGIWRDNPAQTHLADGPAPAPDALRGYPQWWEILDDDSFDEIYPPRSWIRVIDAGAIAYAPRAGDYVVIERARGGRTERTLKEIVMRAGKLHARTRSHNPAQKAEFPIGDDPDTDDRVRIAGYAPGDSYYRP